MWTVLNSILRVPHLLLITVLSLLIASGWGSLFAQEIVAKIDLTPETGNGVGPSGIAVNSKTNRIYIANNSDNISVIDGLTNKIIDTIDGMKKVGGVAVNEVTNRIYVVNSDSSKGTVSVIDGETHQIIATVPVGFSPVTVAVNPNTNLVYVSTVFIDLLDNFITVIDGATNEAVSILKFETGIGGSGTRINTATNRIYIADSLQFIYALDGDTNQIVATIEVDGLFNIIGVNPTTNRIYVNNFGNDKILVIDGFTNKIIEEFTIEAGIRSVAINHNSNLIYIASNNPDNNIIVVDGSTNKVAGAIDVLGDTLGGIEVNPVTNFIYVINAHSNSVSIISGSTGKVIETVGVGFMPLYIGVNKSSNKVYIAGAANKVVVINSADNTKIKTLKVGNRPGGIGVNNITNKIYVANMGNDNISVIDGSIDEVAETVNTREFKGELVTVAVNSETNQIYAAKNNYDIPVDSFIPEGTVLAIDGAGNKLVDVIDVGAELVALDINTVTNNIYVLSKQPTDPRFSNTIYKVNVINGMTNEVDFIIELGPSSEMLNIAVNPVIDRIYVSNRGEDRIEVINGLTNRIIATVELFKSLLTIAVNQSNNHVYAIGAGVIDIIDGIQNRFITSVHLGSGAVGINVNHDTHLIYATQASPPSVSVILDNVELPSLTPIPTPPPTLTPSPTPDVSPTPTPVSIARLIVNPETSGSTLRLKEAAVTVLDSFGMPVSNINVKASAHGFGVIVTPSSMTTGKDGAAKFKFRFGFIRKHGEIVFNVNGITATITQK